MHILYGVGCGVCHIQGPGGLVGEEEGWGWWEREKGGVGGRGRRVGLVRAGRGDDVGDQ